MPPNICKTSYYLSADETMRDIVATHFSDKVLYASFVVSRDHEIDSGSSSDQ
jgi:hypothetical protein